MFMSLPVFDRQRGRARVSGRRLAMLLAFLCVVCCLLCVFYTNGWQMVDKTDLLEVRMEQKLYTSPQSHSFVLHFRLTNRTDKEIRLFNAGYSADRPATFEEYRHSVTLACDCPISHEYMQPDTLPLLNEIRRKSVLAAFRQHQGVVLAPHGHLDFYAGHDDHYFTAPAGPAEINLAVAAVLTDMVPGSFQHRLAHLMPFSLAVVKLWITGYCFVSDGNKVEMATGNDTWIPAPPLWAAVPEGALAFFGSQVGDDAHHGHVNGRAFAAVDGDRLCSLYEGGAYYASCASSHGKPSVDTSKQAFYYNNCAYSYCDLEDYDQALWHADVAIEKDRSMASAYNARALIQYRLGKYKQALADCDLALKLDPEFASAANTRAMVLLALKDYGQALEAADRAVDDYPEAYVIKAEAHAARHENDAARQCGQMALAHKAAIPYSSYMLRSRPYLPMYYTARAYLLLAEVEDAAGNNRQALALYQHALNYAWGQWDHVNYGEYFFGNRDKVVSKHAEAVPGSSLKWIVRTTPRVYLALAGQIHQSRAKTYAKHGQQELSASDASIAAAIASWLRTNQSDRPAL